MADSFAQFGRKLDAISRDLSDKRVLTIIGVGAKADVSEAVHRDFGDESMSNFRRGNPIPMRARFDIEGETVKVQFAGKAKGPGAVAQRGRRAGVSRKGRRYGASTGKGTWDDATKLMEKNTPKRVAEQLPKVIAKHIGR